MNFLQRIKDGAGKVTDRAQNAVEIGRLNTQISNIEREMGLYFQKMGEVFYEGYSRKDMSNAEKEMVELAKTCDLLSEERDEIRAKIAELKNERLCGACGKAIAEDALFCQYCGRKLDKAKTAVGKKSPAKEAEEDRDHGLQDPLSLFAEPVSDETIIYKEPVATMSPVVEEEREHDEFRRKRELERERERQEELDRRIRTWKENVEPPKKQVSSALETGIPTVSCQICSSVLVKGTKWCPHCGSEQI
ncbi:MULTISPECIES: zinc-ribbon domain-containing protein [Paenibacillus]|uniref:zinc-ribbon domain-containing protein n=1 Tax=Paenibacillus TaxID=44249 RepID=UPI002FDF7720